MKLEDLTTDEKRTLSKCIALSRYDFKFVGEERMHLNVLAAYGLVKEAGNLGFEPTPAGMDMFIQNPRVSQWR